MIHDPTTPAATRPPVRRRRAAAGILLACVAAVTASAGAAATTTVTVAGDIATCGGEGDERTAALVSRQPGIVMTAGDNVYPSGTFRQFQRCYRPSWGRFKDRTRPALGNHDWATAGAAGYFRYFGQRAGPARQGYYAFRAGGWRIYVLDTTRCFRGDDGRTGCGRGSAQYQWLAEQLAAHPKRCVMAVAHHPRFSSGPGGDHQKVAPLLWLLYRAGAELVINGHDHSYERFALARPDGTRDTAHGMRQIVAGTGGAYRTDFEGDPARGSVARSRASHGVLRLRLDAAGYRWKFLRTDGKAGDSGRGTCHGPAPD